MATAAVQNGSRAIPRGNQVFPTRAPPKDSNLGLGGERASCLQSLDLSFQILPFFWILGLRLAWILDGIGLECTAKELRIASRLITPARAHRCAALRMSRCHACPARPQGSPRTLPRRVALLVPSVSISPTTAPRPSRACPSCDRSPAAPPSARPCHIALVCRLVSAPRILHTTYAPLHSAPTPTALPRPPLRLPPRVT